MSTFTPRNYQRENIDELVAALSTSLTLDGSKRRITVLKAPTGSGKTVMLALALDAASHTNPDNPFITLWLTPGKGALDAQSAARLSQVLEDSPRPVALLTTQYLSANPTAEPGTILVSNWESLVRWDAKNHDWNNHLTRTGEQRNLFDFLTTNASRGNDLVVVFDESHTHVTGDRARLLLDSIGEITPIVEVHASATPIEVVPRSEERVLGREGRFHWVEVPFDDVVAAGMVKKTAELNLNLELLQDAHPEMTGERLVLQAAWEKLNELRDAYAESGSPVSPLLLVQVPNADAGNQRLDSCIDFFTQAGLKMDRELAIWVNKEKTPDLSRIADFDSPVRVLLFKQAVATGWDCPRAHVLVQFRETKSNTFAIQTLGRIMRMPEHRHYDDERLNKAYVYSDLEADKVTIRCDDVPESKVIDTTLKRRPDLYGAGISLRSVWAPRQRDLDYVTYAVESHLMSRLDSALAGLPEDPDGAATDEVLRDVSLSAEDLSGLEQDLEVMGDTLSLGLGDDRIRVEFDALLVEDIRPYPISARRDSLTRIKTVVRKWFAENRPAYVDAQDIAAACLMNRSAVTNAIHEACEAVASQESAQAKARALAKREVTDGWEVPEQMRVAAGTFEPAGAGIVFSPALARPAGSQPERDFEKWLLAQGDRVVWWWRNGGRDRTSLAVTYPGEDGTQDADITFPDYLFLTSDNVLWMVEVKSEEDPDGEPGKATHRKARGLSDWASEMCSRPGCPEVFPEVRAAVVVPYRSGSGVVVRAGDPDSWHAPSRPSLAEGTGWSPFKLS